MVRIGELKFVYQDRNVSIATITQSEDVTAMTSTLLSGGTVFDSEAGRLAPGDVWVTDDLIADPPGSGAQYETIDASGLIVSPGLVDLHAHVFRGQDLGLSPDEIGGPSGTTTIVDAGSAGGHLFSAFRLTTVDTSRVRVRAFVNIASVGTTSILLGGELKGLYYSNEDVAVECIENNRDIAVGVKVRASHDVGGTNALESLHRARRVADRVGLPLMVHLGPPPASIDEIAHTLQPGDILTHAFTGWEGNSVVHDGKIRPSIRAARDRGVILDVGHGMSGFSSTVARTMIELGELPDTISTDLHTYSRPFAVDLPAVLSKFMALGMSVQQVLTSATISAARAVGLDSEGVGSLKVGTQADIALFRLDSRPTEYGDGFGATFEGQHVLTPVLTMIGGSTVFREVRA